MSVPLLTRLKNRFVYFSDHCGLREVTYVITPRNIPIFKRLFWLFTITACCIGSAIVLRGVLSLYTSDAISYSVETDYLEWDTPFPAFTVCENNENNNVKIKRFINEQKLPKSLTDFVKEVTYWNSKYCKSCDRCKLGTTCVNNFMDLVNALALNCTSLMTDCWWNGEPFKCCDRFLPIRTEYGTCYVFNSRLTGDGSIITFNRKYGLPKLEFTAISDVMVRIHSPDDIVSVASDNILPKCFKLPLIHDMNVALRAEQTVSDVSVQLTPPGSRDCLFRHELPSYYELWPFQYYSYSACTLFTRALIQTDDCNCTHHFMPRLGNFPTCDLSGLACLYKSTQKDRDTEDKYHCPMSCEETVYKALVHKCVRYTERPPEDLAKRGTRGILFMGSFPTLRERRYAVRQLLGLVVDVGGIIGVFFGASILSVLEIIYLLFIRQLP